MPVLGERIVVRYDRNGSLLAISGRWSSVNYAQSKFETTASDDDVVALAIETALLKNADPDSDAPMHVGTNFVVEKRDDDPIFKMEGRVEVIGNGPSGSRKISAHAFPL